MRRALLEALVDRLFAEASARGERLPIRISPTVSADTWEALAEKREQARALTREGLMLKARDGAYGIGRRKGGDRADVWWKWKLDPMSVDAVVIYAERGHGRRSGVYTDYTFAVWSAGEEAGTAGARAVRQGLFGAHGCVAAQLLPSQPMTPAYFQVLANSLNIMEDQITRTRLAGEPPHIMLAPRLGQIGPFEFHRASEGITEGRASVQQALPHLQRYL